jgi:hypothetical protein
VAGDGVGAAAATVDGVDAEPDDAACGAVAVEAAAAIDLPAVAGATGAVVPVVVVVVVVVAAGAVDAVPADAV